MDIGVFAPGTKENLGKPLFLQKRLITKPVETFEIVVSEKHPKDNTKSL